MLLEHHLNGALTVAERKDSAGVDRRILRGSKTRRLGSRVFFEFKHKTLAPDNQL